MRLARRETDRREAFARLWKWNPIERVDFRAGELIRDHPPRWHDPNKRVVFNIAGSSGVPFEGQIVFARWEKEQPVRLVTVGGQFSIRLGAFDYAAAKEATVDGRGDSDACHFGRSTSLRNRYSP